MRWTGALLTCNQCSCSTPSTTNFWPRRRSTRTSAKNWTRPSTSCRATERIRQQRRRQPTATVVAASPHFLFSTASYGLHSSYNNNNKHRLLHFCFEFFLRVSAHTTLSNVTPMIIFFWQSTFCVFVILVSKRYVVYLKSHTLLDT